MLSSHIRCQILFGKTCHYLLVRHPTIKQTLLTSTSSTLKIGVYTIVYSRLADFVTSKARSLASLVRSYSSLRLLNRALGPLGHRAL